MFLRRHKNWTPEVVLIDKKKYHPTSYPICFVFTSSIKETIYASGEGRICYSLCCCLRLCLYAINVNALIARMSTALTEKLYINYPRQTRIRRIDEWWSVFCKRVWSYGQQGDERNG